MMDRKECTQSLKPALDDLNTGKMIEVRDPDDFRLETILLHSGYYSLNGQEFRFRLSEARIAGLKIEKASA